MVPLTHVPCNKRDVDNLRDAYISVLNQAQSNNVNLQQQAAHNALLDAQTLRAQYLLKQTVPPIQRLVDEIQYHAKLQKAQCRLLQIIVSNFIAPKNSAMFPWMCSNY